MHGIDLDADIVTNAQLSALNTSMRRELRQHLTRSSEWVRDAQGWHRKDAQTQTEEIAADEEQSPEVQAEVEEAPQEPETPEQPEQEPTAEVEVEEAPKPKPKRKAPAKKKAAPKTDAESDSE